MMDGFSRLGEPRRPGVNLVFLKAWKQVMWCGSEAIGAVARDLCGVNPGL